MIGARTPSGGGGHNEINDIVRKLNTSFSLGLPIRSVQISPHKVPADERNQCFDLIKTCYWSARGQLHQTLETFEAQVGPVPDSDRVSYLVRLLKEVLQPKSRGKNGVVGDDTAKSPVSIFTQKLLSARNLPSDTISEHSNTSDHILSAHPSDAESDANSVTSSDALWDRDSWRTPPQSPTPAARSWTRAASNERTNRRRQSDNNVESSSSRKRRSNEFSPDRGSPKYHKCSNGVRTRNSSTSEFRTASQTPVDYTADEKPSWSQETTIPSLHTSFGSTIPDGRVIKSVNTSFTSVDSAPIPDPEKRSKHSASDSLNISWPDSDALEAALRAGDFPPPNRGEHDRYGSGSISWDTETKEQILSMVDRYDKFVSPTKPLNELTLESPKDAESDTNEAAEHHLVRDFPKSGLLLADRQSNGPVLPFRVRYECARVALANRLPLEDTLPINEEFILDYRAMWSHVEGLKRTFPKLKLPRRGNSKAWQAALGDYDRLNLSGRLSLNKAATISGSLFSLSLDPIDFDNSCRFQRAFGGDRFLYLKVSRLSNLPKSLKGQEAHVKKRFLEWLSVEKKFLGRSWRVMHLEAHKPTKAGRKSKKEKDFQYRIVLFATSGCDILPKMPPPYKFNGYYSSKPETSLEELIRWFMPINKMMGESFCKAYARLDLGFSRTTPTIVFPPDKVIYVDDKRADGTPEDTSFDDPAFNWVAAHEFNDQRVMNDGCSRISLGACRLIWQKLGGDGPIPSAFQARLNGAKGVWIRSAPTDSTSDRHNDIWIEVSKSQKKFPPHDEDTPLRFDPNRWTFEIIKYTKKTTPFVLHLAFIPILVSRGVLDSKIEQLTNDFILEERDRLLEALESSVSLRYWINSHYSMAEERQRNNALLWQAGLPLSTIEKVIFLLEHGFEPGKLPHLGDLIVRMTRDWFSKIVRSISIRVNRSTNVIGIADPIGVLEPGEIQLAFSQAMIDELSGETTTFLRDREVIVTRHPCLRISDMQKVRAVYKQELAHLVDCVIFPSKGCIPLASKLQGGDYDGDTFWVCWDNSIVHSFLNAPPALHLPPPGDLGIRVEQRKLSEVMPEANWLEESHAFRCSPDLLGQCTVEHEKQSYAELSVDSEGVNRLADLHDFLIDSAKNGFKFDEKDYKLFLADPRIKYKRPPLPAYKEAMENGILSISGLKRKPCSAENTMRNASKPNLDHVVDRLFFTIIEPQVLKTMQLVETGLKGNQNGWDIELYTFYSKERNLNRGDAVIDAEFSALNSSLKEIHSRWVKGFSSQNFKEADAPFEDPDLYNDVLDECFTAFTKLRPVDISHPIVKRWTLERIGDGPTRWTLLKASCLFKLFHEKSTFTFHIAGRDLAYIKAHSGARPRLIVEQLWTHMKPRKFKKDENEVGVVEAAQMARDRSWKAKTTEETSDDSSDEEAEADDDFYSVVGSQIQDDA